MERAEAENRRIHRLVFLRRAAQISTFFQHVSLLEFCVNISTSTRRAKVSAMKVSDDYSSHDLL
jgi:hypothetical protein